MINKDNVKQILDKAPAEALSAEGTLLLVELGAGGSVEDAVRCDPKRGEVENLVLSTYMDVGDIDGVEESAEISEEEDSGPLAELSLYVDGRVEVEEFEVPRLLIWNHSGRPLAVGGDVVEAGECLLISEVPAESWGAPFGAL